MQRLISQWKERMPKNSIRIWIPLAASPHKMGSMPAAKALVVRLSQLLLVAQYSRCRWERATRTSSEGCLGHFTLDLSRETRPVTRPLAATGPSIGTSLPELQASFLTISIHSMAWANPNGSKLDSLRNTRSSACASWKPSIRSKLIWTRTRNWNSRCTFNKKTRTDCWN